MGEFIIVEGAGAFDAALQKMVKGADLAGRIATGRAGHAVEARTKAKLTARANSKGEPSPSAPGEPPATITGTLKRSVRVKGPLQVGFGAYRAEVGPTVIYGRIQELGGDIYPTAAPHLRFQFAGGWVTTDHVHIPARPFLKPALEEAMPDLFHIYRQAWLHGTRPI